MNESRRELSDTKLTSKKLSSLIALIESGKISNAAGKKVFDIILNEDKEPMDVVKEKGLLQISDDGALEQVVQDVMAANAKSIQDYRNGKTNALGYLTGQCMKATKGQGNPAKLKQFILDYLENNK